MKGLMPDQKTPALTKFVRLTVMSLVSWASPLPHGQLVFNCCPAALDAAAQSEDSIQSWYVASPNIRLMTKCGIDNCMVSLENCVLEMARSMKTWRKSKY